MAGRVPGYGVGLALGDGLWMLVLAVFGEWNAHACEVRSVECAEVWCCWLGIAKSDGHDGRKSDNGLHIGWIVL
jgi:hypothetical protein